MRILRRIYFTNNIILLVLISTLHGLLPGLGLRMARENNIAMLVKLIWGHCSLNRGFKCRVGSLVLFDLLLAL